MRVLIFHNKYKIRGGEDVVVERELELLKSHGHAVEVHYEHNVKISGLEKIRTALNSTYSEEFKQKAKLEIEKFKPDIVHVHNFFPLITPSIFDACLETKTPSVMTLHNYRIFCANGLFLRDGKICDLCLNGSPYQAALYGCYQGSRIGSFFVAKMQDHHQKMKTWNEDVDKLIAITKFAKKTFVSGGISDSKIAIKANFGPDLSKFSSAEEDFYLYFGRLSAEKGIHTLLKAWKDIPAKLVLLGDDSSNYAKEFSAPNISFLGNTSQEEAWKWLGKTRGMIFPTECFEGGFPSVLIEALSIGTAIVASEIGGIPEFLKHDENALLFQPGNAASLKSAILELESKPELRKLLRKAARNTYENYLTPKIGYTTLLSIYQDAIDHYKRR